MLEELCADCGHSEDEHLDGPCSGCNCMGYVIEDFEDYADEYVGEDDLDDR